MPRSARRIAPEDILPQNQYAAERAARRQAIIALKRARRAPVGPFATFYFENYDTMLQQVQEMLHIERGGAAQLADELGAYNPLIPQGRELCATFMLEIADEGVRARALAGLGGIDEAVYLDVGGARIRAAPETEIERTKEDGKTSSVHFLHFPFTDAAADAFKTPGARVVLGVEHPRYAHMAVLSEETRAALAQDLA
jgi:hypothetical protein